MNLPDNWQELLKNETYPSCLSKEARVQVCTQKGPPHVTCHGR